MVEVGGEDELAVCVSHKFRHPYFSQSAVSPNKLLFVYSQNSGQESQLFIKCRSWSD